MAKQGWNLDNSYARLPEDLYSKIEPSPVRDPELVKLNESLAEELGLNVEDLKSEEGVAVLAGNEAPEGSQPIAQAYAGHQFGNFTMLGDGRAMLYGEQITPDGDRVDIQLKGSGRTPYSRGGDGRAALGPMLREYIISEAMHALGIPSTRSLAVVTTGEPIIREKQLPGAILTRVASSHIRVGTFQYVRGRGNEEDLRALADYTIDRHYPYLKDKGEDRYLILLKEVMKRQAELIAKWQLVGFIHGVMNTDNMALSGETIDYGPCAFMDTFDAATVFSSIDTQGRYAYRNQPAIGAWNLARFAETLLPLLHEDQDEAVKLAEKEIGKFSGFYNAYWISGMRGKLGIFNEEAEDETLCEDLLKLMQEHKADYTNTFRALTFDKLEDSDLYKTDEFTQWQKRWQERLERQEESKDQAHQLMKDNNPAVIPRNHRVEEALEAAVEREDYNVMEKLLDALSNPYAHTPEQEEYCTLPETDRPYVTYCGT
ncbi:protein adenylyltransferase SelO [Pseudalkalibacillus sp. R45]|uniref:protein adenylyltransferase SelO n=1 Tax=Pseudalkalibacillus sp. R45 TaxID=3457433 RepID=UPI003FCD7025